LPNIPEEQRSLVVGCCEHGHEPSGSMKWGELPDQLSKATLKDSDSWCLPVP